MYKVQALSSTFGFICISIFPCQQKFDLNAKYYKLFSEIYLIVHCLFEHTTQIDFTRFASFESCWRYICKLLLKIRERLATISRKLALDWRASRERLARISRKFANDWRTFRGNSRSNGKNTQSVRKFLPETRAQLAHFAQLATI